MFAQRSQKSDTYTARLPFGSTKKYKVMTQLILYKHILGNPLPESCVGLCITLCTEWVLKTHIGTHIFAQQSQKSESYTARLPFGRTKKT